MADEKNTGPELASFEGRYPKDLFNKSVIANGQTIGYVAKEAKDVITVFGESGDSRFDIPKSKIEISGGSVIVDSAILQECKIDKDAPLPHDSNLRPTADEIRRLAERPQDDKNEIGWRAEDTIQSTRADAVIGEGSELAARPRSETVGVETPAGYVLSEIGRRTYAEQEQIYAGFLKLMDSQQKLLVARRNLATRLKSSVPDAVVTKTNAGHRERARRRR